MNAIIYYFTGTGNSLQAARELAFLLGNATLCPITSEMDANFSAPLIGIVFPVYLWGMPKVVAEFVQKINADKVEHYIFAVATYKSQTGDAIGQLRRKMMQQKINLSAGFTVQMPGNNIIFYNIESSDVILNKLSDSKIVLAQIAQSIAEKKQIFPKASLFDRFVKTGLLHSILTGTFEKSDKKFWIEASCNGCGICCKVCPMGNISMADSHPVWQHRCQQCLACIHSCPANAIQFGKTTRGKKRYLNPAVSAQDLIKRDN